MPSADKRARQKENARAAREQREAAVKKSKRNRSIMTFGIIAALFVGLIVILSLTGSKKKDDKKAAATTTTTAPTLPAGCVSTKPPKADPKTYKAPPPMTIDTSKTYVAHFTTTCGDFDVTLDAKNAPNTVNSFVFLAGQHFYDGLTFQRVAKDFVVQGGDPNGDGSGGPGYNLATEPPKNGYKQGSVAMANAGPDTTGSQFFLVLSETGAKGLGGPPYLYSGLGTVTKGFENVQKLGSLYNKDQDPADPSTQKTSVPLYMFKVTTTES
jgi:cyclophilin family peptidyl-prolyl cis-trans isomerase